MKFLKNPTAAAFLLLAILSACIACFTPNFHDQFIENLIYWSVIVGVLFSVPLIFWMKHQEVKDREKWTRKQ